MYSLQDLEIEYRFSPRRKSIGLTVTAAGKLVVSAPRGVSRAALAAALTRHRAWIEKTAAQRQEAWAQIREGMAYFLGQAYRLVAAPGAPEAVALRDGEIRVRPRAPGGDSWGPLNDWYHGQAESFLKERVHHFAAVMGLKARVPELRDWKRRWGECHVDGKLRFNWRLILLPPAIIDYVVAHELAHLKVPGHNPRFWWEVETALPDWAARRRWLNRYGGPFLLWRRP
jgi:predicted metal-dependent hydrolase